METVDRQLDDLASALDGLASWVRRQVPPAMSLSTMSALSRLVAEGPLRVTELAAREAVSQPGITVLVNRLERSGLVRRDPDPSDRRATLVDVTDAGRDALTHRRAERAAAVRARLAELAGDDHDLLVAALPAVNRLLRADEHATATTAAPMTASPTDHDSRRSAS